MRNQNNAVPMLQAGRIASMDLLPAASTIEAIGNCLGVISQKLESREGNFDTWGAGA